MPVSVFYSWNVLQFILPSLLSVTSLFPASILSLYVGSPSFFDQSFSFPVLIYSKPSCQTLWNQHSLQTNIRISILCVEHCTPSWSDPNLPLPNLHYLFWFSFSILSVPFSSSNPPFSNCMAGIVIFFPHWIQFSFLHYGILLFNLSVFLFQKEVLLWLPS